MSGEHRNVSGPGGSNGRDAAFARLHPIAQSFAPMPTVVADLLARHRDDGRGKCAGCALPQAGNLPWPCTLATYARQARDYHRRYEGGPR